MGKKQKRHFTDEFKREALRILLTSGRTVAQVQSLFCKGCGTG